MCGRISQKGKRESFKDFVYNFEPDDDLDRPNIKPTSYVPIVVHEDDNVKTIDARWWFQKNGATAFETKYTTFNARVENIETSFLYKPSLKNKRCIVPISSFYEWDEKGKPPFEIFANGDKPFSLAGLWSHWFEEGKRLYSFTIITCEPNDFMKSIHNRMPVILDSLERQEEWLKSGSKDLLIPFTQPMHSQKLPAPIETFYQSSK